MAVSRLPWHTAARCSHRLLPKLQFSRIPSHRRAFSYQDAVDARPTLFTLNTRTKKLNRDQLVKLLSHQWQNLEPQYTANTEGHDAAVVLVSPGFSKLLTDNAFLGDVAKLLGHSGQSGEPLVSEFHILGAVADRIHQIALSSRIDEGISILRSHKNVLLPTLWDPATPKDQQDTDAVSALTFEFPSTELDATRSMTVPLARTLFENGKPSTLLASKFDISNESSPKVIQTMESHIHTVSLPTRSGIEYWAPLLPLTHARPVRQSFGNILREIEVDGEALPASTELEDAIINKLPNIDLGLGSEPVSVFAIVTPESSASGLSMSPPQPTLDLPGASLQDDSVTDQIHHAADYFQEALLNGARVFKVLSGGGGWGKKKGLLSLDPQISHFTPSEDEQMDMLFGSGPISKFAPEGSVVQFFAACPLPPPTDQSSELAVFGVSGDSGRLLGDDPEFGRSVCGGFGATSDQGVYIHSKTTGLPDERVKLSVPGSQLTFPVAM